MARPARGTLAELRPDIAAQLVDKSLADKLSVGSSTSVEWECEHGHRWKTSVFNRTNPKHPTGCPVCKGKKVLVGYNSVADTDPDIVKYFANPDDAYKYTRLSNKKVLWRCDHGHTWEAPISRVVGKTGFCPYCSGRLAIPGETDLATTNPDLAAQLLDPSLASSLKEGSHKKVKWVCAEDSRHIWEASPYDRMRGFGCPYCNNRYIEKGINDLATIYPDLAAQLVDPDEGTKVSALSYKILKWRCTEHPDHVWEASVWNRVRNHSGCPYCDNKKVKEGFNDIATTRPDLVERMVHPELAKLLTAGSTQVIEWKCLEDSSHTWEASVISESRKTTASCPICGHVHRSYEEQELEKIVRTLVGSDEKIMVSARKIIGADRELDLYLPDKKFAIEFNGTYWHSEVADVDPQYHKDKYTRCLLRGITLFQIWEDDWWDRKEICIRSLAAKLGVLKNLPLVFPGINSKIFESIGARELTCEQIGTEEITAFMGENHIQGFTSGKYYLGLRDADGLLRAAMVLRSPSQSALQGRAPGEWEIARYATLGQVHGGFSKLLKYAEKVLRTHVERLDMWISFSANMVSDGGMYEKTGFVRLSDVAPDYDYVGGLTRWYRVGKESFRKSRFMNDYTLTYQDGWTEHEAALANKLYRIYDAGKVKWGKLPSED